MTAIEVYRVWLDPRPDHAYVVIFRECEGDRAIPMAIGVHEARAIQMALEGTVLERPLTHDLYVSVLGELDARLDHVEIREYRDSTYYADLVLEKDGEIIRLDARPSDCAAIALRCRAPILASEDVFAAADARIVEEPDGFTILTGGESQSVPEDPRSAKDVDAFRRIILDADIEDEDS